MAKQAKKTVTLFGNLGADPRLHQIPARTETSNVYDPIIDDVVEKSFDREAQEFAPSPSLSGIRTRRRPAGFTASTGRATPRSSARVTVSA